MPIQTLGDMSQHFTSLRNGGAIKSDLARLGQELSSGRVADVTAHLGGDTRGLSGINHSLTLLSSFQLVAKETNMMLDNMQMAISRVEQVRSSTASSLLLINEHSQAAQIQNGRDAAIASFEDVVATINGRFAGKSVFGGADVVNAPLAPADAMIADIMAGIGINPTNADIVQQVNDWFDTPGGGFATFGYQGDTGPEVSTKVSSDQTIHIDARADNESFRAVLKAAALGAVASELSGSLSQIDLGRLLQKSGTELLAASSATATMQSSIGFQQEVVSNTQARQSAELSALQIAYNDLTASDPFETAVQIEAVQTQLETHFALTGRLSRLSLLEYI